jgi:hypothetical protein
MRLAKQIEAILREGARKGVPIEDIRDAIVQIIIKRDNKIIDRILKTL